MSGLTVVKSATLGWPEKEPDTLTARKIPGTKHPKFNMNSLAQKRSHFRQNKDTSLAVGHHKMYQ